MNSRRTESPRETFELGRNLARKLTNVDLVLLTGEMGAGKTLLTKGILSGFGIDPGEVVSPTFTLMNRFQQGESLFYHIDLYRLEGHRLTECPEIDDHLGEGLVIVEWAQYLDASYFDLPRTLWVKLEVLAGEKRRIRFGPAEKESGKTIQQRENVR